MTRTERFAFAVEVSLAFLATEPVVAQEWLDAQRDQIAKVQFMRGPRGGAYRLTTPPDDWRVNIDGFWRPDRAMYVTKRYGRYTRPSRVPPLSEDWIFGTFTIAVKDGQAMLPNGSIVHTPSQFISVPVAPPLTHS